MGGPERAREIEGLMCGIVGYLGDQEVVPLLIESLRKLEYRGYDSAGVVVRSNGELKTIKAEGKLERLAGKQAMDLR